MKTSGVVVSLCAAAALAVAVWLVGNGSDPKLLEPDATAAKPPVAGDFSLRGRPVEPDLHRRDGEELVLTVTDPALRPLELFTCTLSGAPHDPPNVIEGLRGAGRIPSKFLEVDGRLSVSALGFERKSYLLREVRSLRSLRVALRPRIDLVGHVVDGEGRGIAGATVWYSAAELADREASDATVTDSAGRFQLIADPKVGMLLARSPAGGTASLGVDAASRSRDLIIQIDWTGTLIGDVRWDDGRPTSAGSIAIFPDGPSDPTAVSSDGSFRVEGIRLRQNWHLRFAFDGATIATTALSEGGISGSMVATVHVVLNSKPVVVHALELPTSARLYGFVRLRDGSVESAGEWEAGSRRLTMRASSFTTGDTLSWQCGTSEGAGALHLVPTRVDGEIVEVSPLSSSITVAIEGDVAERARAWAIPKEFVDGGLGWTSRVPAIPLTHAGLIRIPCDAGWTGRVVVECEGAWYAVEAKSGASVRINVHPATELLLTLQHGHELDGTVATVSIKPAFPMRGTQSVQRFEVALGSGRPADVSARVACDESYEVSVEGEGILAERAFIQTDCSPRNVRFLSIVGSTSVAIRVVSLNSPVAGARVVGSQRLADGSARSVSGSTLILSGRSRSVSALTNTDGLAVLRGLGDDEKDIRVTREGFKEVLVKLATGSHAQEVSLVPSKRTVARIRYVGARQSGSMEVTLSDDASDARRTFVTVSLPLLEGLGRDVWIPEASLITMGVRIPGHAPWADDLKAGEDGTFDALVDGSSSWRCELLIPSRGSAKDAENPVLRLSMRGVSSDFPFTWDVPMTLVMHREGDYQAEVIDRAAKPLGIRSTIHVSRDQAFYTIGR